jgi:hypothetical protein
MRLRGSDTVHGSDVVTKNSNLMRHFDNFEGIQPITGHLSVPSDTLILWLCFDGTRNEIWLIFLTTAFF